MQLEVSLVSPVPPRAETCGSVEHLFSGAGKKRPEGDPFSLKERYPNSAAPTSRWDFYLAGEEVKAELRGVPQHHPALAMPPPPHARISLQVPLHPWDFSPTAALPSGEGVSSPG